MVRVACTKLEVGWETPHPCRLSGKGASSRPQGNPAGLRQVRAGGLGTLHPHHLATRNRSTHTSGHAHLLGVSLNLIGPRKSE